MAKKYLIETFGCQMNFHDSERMAGLLEQAGFEPTLDESDAEVIVINTCSVREGAQEKLFSRLGEIRAASACTGHHPTVAVTGCVAQQEGEKILTRSPVVGVVIGTQAIKRLPMLVAQKGEGSCGTSATRDSVVDINPYEDVSFPLGVTRRSDPLKAYVTIIEGCNDFCAFCVVPYTRGHERMRPATEILAEVQEAVDGGRVEIHLLGQIVNHYQAPDDPSCDFAALLDRVSRIRGVQRIRFASPHPRHVTRRLIEAVRDLSQVCKHLHLPVQSGSTTVLRAMRRRHTREEYLELVATIREAVPGIALSTDMIVGFPGETPEDFEQTLSLVRAVGYHSMFSFKYSPRPNTLAIKRMPDDVTEVEKTARIVALQTLQREIQLEIHGATVGKVVDVLVDSRSRRHDEDLAGRTTGNTVVNFPGRPEWLGRTIQVRVDRAGPNSLWGTPLLA